MRANTWAKMDEKLLERVNALIEKVKAGGFPFSEQQLLDLFSAITKVEGEDASVATARINKTFQQYDNMLSTFESKIGEKAKTMVPLGSGLGAVNLDAIKNHYKLSDKWKTYFAENASVKADDPWPVLSDLALSKLESIVDYSGSLQSYAKSRGVDGELVFGKGLVITKRNTLSDVERGAAASDFLMLEAQKKKEARELLPTGIIGSAEKWISSNYDPKVSLKAAKSYAKQSLTLQKQRGEISEADYDAQYNKLDEVITSAIKTGDLAPVQQYRDGGPVVERVKGSSARIDEQAATPAEVPAPAPIVPKEKVTPAATEKVAPAASNAAVPKKETIEPMSTSAGTPEVPSIPTEAMPVAPVGQLSTASIPPGQAASRKAAVAELKNADGQVQDPATGQWHKKDSPEGLKLMAGYNAAVQANAAQQAAQAPPTPPTPPQGPPQGPSPDIDPEKMTGQFQEVLDALKRGDTTQSIANAASFLQDFTGMIAGMNMMGDNQLEDYKPSKYLNEMVRMSRNMVETGIPETVEEQRRGDIRRGLDVDLGVVKAAAGGSGGAVLGTRFQSIRDYNDALSKVSAEDMEAKFRAMPFHMDALGQMEQAHKDSYMLRYEQEVAKQNAAAELVSGSIKNMHNAAQMQQYYGKGSVNSVLKWADALKIGKEMDQMEAGGNALAESLKSVSGVAGEFSSTYGGAQGTPNSPVQQQLPQ